MENMAQVTTRLHDDVLVVTADNPPVNALAQPVRAGLAEAIAVGAADERAKALVIACAGRTFFAGADISEFGKPSQPPPLPEVITAIETCRKPVVAAIHGTALGGGLEVALGCHYRIAVPSAKLGQPEVKLGILPGAGGTQRLPRLIGVEAALSMIVSGDPVGAREALESGLVDRLAAEGALLGEAIAFAREMAARAEHPRTSARADKIARAAADPGVFDRFRAQNARRLKGLDAPAACIEAVEAAVRLPFDDGMKEERRLFAKLVASDQSKALRHVFFAERAANKIDGVPADAPLIPVAKVGVLGAGTMGGGIAMNFLSAGIPVTILERDEASLGRGVGVMRKNYERTASRGRMTSEAVEAAMGRLRPTLSYDDFADCDLIIEAVFEDMALKKSVFGRLDAVAKPGAILATNTSYLDVDEIASATGRPESVLGLHFFSPANVMRLLEIVRGAKTSPSVLATAMALAKTIRKVAVVSGVCHGFIGNRMLARRRDQANALILEGAKYWDVDRVLRDFGMPMGPFEMGDLAGLDIGWSAETSRGATVREVLCERGRRGQKTGKGFYDYDAERNRTPSEETQAIIEEFAARSGVQRRTIDDAEILERLLYPMINEGARILEERIAQRASDIDVVWINGYGWPAQTGGPMFWADTVGLDRIAARLDALAERLGDNFAVSPLLREKAASGGRFNA
jgi:3-hydroxyacyl-CoA dehydrogenase